MMLDYFYGQSGKLFAYFRIPKALFQDSRFRQLSTDARTLYGILLDRMSLSAKNGWLDEQGRVYIIYTVREVQESLCCAEHKAVKLFRELEQADLIERKRRGLGKPSLIYVKNFSSGLPKAQAQNCANSNSCAAENAVQVQPKPQSNKTEKNKTERNHPFFPDKTDRLTQREQLEDYFYQALEVELLLRLCPDDEDTIYQIVDLLVDTCSTKREMLRIAGDDKPAEVVRSRLKKLNADHERMFLVTFLILNTGRTEQELENNVFQASSIAQKHNCNLCRLDYQQEQGLMSSLPLADCQIEIQRGLTTSSTAIFIPFTTQELYQSGKESLYYGLNALSSNLIMVDRKRLKNPNGLILGTPGSGKSFSAKREIANAFLVTDDDIIINDPEGEYSPLVNRLKGQVIKISPNSTQFINPMDINSNYSEEDNPLSLKADFILSLCELVVGGKEGLLPVEKTVIDRCVHLIYRKYFADPCPENMPILEDLYNALLQQDEKEAHHVATALEIYVKGSLNLFNHRTNVNVNNRIVCYDIKELGKQMKKLGMLIVQDQVWGRVTANRSSGKSTRYYMDEMHLLLKEEQTAAYSVEIWKRFRKWGGIPTGLTQNVKDLLSSREVENIFENSDMIIMLNQAAGDRQILAKQLNISPHQLSYVTHSGEGEGLLFFGNVILPFVDRFPTDLELYRIMTTKLGEVSEGAQK